MEGYIVNEIIVPMPIPSSPKHQAMMAGGIAAAGVGALAISAIRKRRINKQIAEKQAQLKQCKDKACIARIKKEIYALKQKLLPAEKRDLPANVKASIDKGKWS